VKNEYPLHLQHFNKKKGKGFEKLTIFTCKKLCGVMQRKKISLQGAMEDKKKS
jgi:hypothetical protein